MEYVIASSQELAICTTQYSVAIRNIKCLWPTWTKYTHLTHGSSLNGRLTLWTDRARAVARHVAGVLIRGSDPVLSGNGGTGRSKCTRGIGETGCLSPQDLASSIIQSSGSVVRTTATKAIWRQGKHGVLDVADK